jgi:hypothetical protein
MALQCQRVSIPRGIKWMAPLLLFLLLLSPLKLLCLFDDNNKHNDDDDVNNKQPIRGTVEVEGLLAQKELVATRKKKERAAEICLIKTRWDRF